VSHFLTIVTLDVTLIFLATSIIVIIGVTIVVVVCVRLISLLLTAIFNLVSRDLAVMTCTGKFCLELLSAILDEERFLTLRFRLLFTFDKLLDIIVKLFLQFFLECGNCPRVISLVFNGLFKRLIMLRDLEFDTSDLLDLTRRTKTD
jgi:hypothetical protein